MFAWWLILIIIGLNGVGLVATLWFVYHYCHPDDLKYNQGILAQVVVIFGFQIAYLSFCLVATDAYNERFEGQFNMSYCWKLVYLMIVIYLSIVLPLAVFYYEADSDPRITKTSPLVQTLKRGSMYIVAVWGVIGLLYLACRKMTIGGEHCLDEGCSVSVPTSQTVTLEFLSYLIGLPGFIGWFVFMFTGGIGIASVPVGLFMKWWHFPKPLPVHEYEKMKKVLGERATALREVGEGLAAHEMRKKNGLRNPTARMRFRSKVSKYKEIVQLLSEEYERLEKRAGGKLNPVKYMFYFVLAMFSFVLTVILWCQVIMACLYPSATGKPPINGISVAFTKMREWRAFFPEFSLYLLIYGHQVLCSVVGMITLNAKMKGCLPVEPLRKKSTHLNAMLFHTAIMLTTCCAIVVLSVETLPSYVEGTEANTIFYMEKNYAKLFKTFYRKAVFQWIWFLLSCLSFIWLSIWPSTKPPVNLEDPKEMAKWAKLNQKLGIDAEAPGGVKDPGVPAEESPGSADKGGRFSKLKDKMHRFDRGVEEAPQKMLGAMVKKPWE
ncbi:putative LMBR1-like protein [Gregarina niphandrodes]|uniref:LMBR1-like protein n=1 Tax=Gregarina niphandrodes TaxID=110365 RepID=A0A023B3V7_GRENI|nr:putative LMBR1-like protein [Gregarina niphandrodes]EZG55995.1 putative LMBR1-like protein [Gregarina niphandrodes]|eukprot:XP_011131383.1 putative LMBR1-like protein [Gregarina niphandrodes]